MEEQALSRDKSAAAAAVKLHEVAGRQARVVAVGLHPPAAGALGGVRPALPRSQFTSAASDMLFSHLMQPRTS